MLARLMFRFDNKVNKINVRGTYVQMAALSKYQELC